MLYSSTTVHVVGLGLSARDVLVLLHMLRNAAQRCLNAEAPSAAAAYKNVEDLIAAQAKPQGVSW